jgi:hypothetical protein
MNHNQNLIEQFNNMTCMPMFELEVINDEYLLVNLSIDEKGIYFEFDAEKPTWFDGGIVRVQDGVYLMPFENDDYPQSLDYYLQGISDNLTEGYLIPNNLMRDE